MARDRRYRIDGAAGTILGGIAMIVFGIVAFAMMAGGDLGSSGRGYFLALLGVPIGVVLIVVGIVRTTRGRR